MQGCFENPFANDTSLDPRALPSLHMRRGCSALSALHDWRRKGVKKKNSERRLDFLCNLRSGPILAVLIHSL